MTMKWYISKAEVIDRAWQDLVSEAAEHGIDISRATSVHIDILDIESDYAGPEAVELAEEEHIGGD